jgi:hypothetical protein
MLVFPSKLVKGKIEGAGPPMNATLPVEKQYHLGERIAEVNSND